MAKRIHLQDLNPKQNFRLPEELIDGYELYVKLRQGEKRGERKVTLIGRPLLNGRVSLYRYAFVNGKKKLEATGAILIPELRSEDKERNKEILRVQREECEKLAVTLREGNATFTPKPKKNAKRQLADYCEGLKEIFKPSFRQTLQALAVHVRKYNPSLCIIDINEQVIKDFINYLNNRAVALNWRRNTKDAPLLADNTKVKLLSMLSMVLNQAVRDKIIIYNPCYLIPKGQRPKKDYERRTYLTPKEVGSLMNTPYPCNANKHGFKKDTPNAFFFSVFTGLRYSDICSLTGENVFKDEEGVYIRFKVKKTGKEQTLYLNDMALQYLPKHMDKAQPLFDIPCNHQVNFNLRKWGKLAGITKDFTFHVARHTTATMELNAGVPMAEVANQLGHSDTKITQIYAKIMRGTQHKATDKMSDFFKEQIKEG